MRIASSQNRGTVTLVALCFVIVLGYALATYLALCSRTMNLSNRTFQDGLGRQLAEAGLEEGLRSFNKNNWTGWTTAGTTVTWDTTTYASSKRAVGTMTFPAGKFGQGVTATVKIRIDNYDAAQLSNTWNSSASYPANTVVNHNGTWYRCLRTNSNQTPNGMDSMAYWAPAPIPSFWSSQITYKVEDMVFYSTNNNWYRCIQAPTSNQVPTNTSYWRQVPSITTDNNLIYTTDAVVNYFGTWYRYTGSGWDNAPAISWRWRTSQPYAFNDLVCYGSGKTWYRCILAHTSSGTITPTNTTYWEPILTGVWAWSGSSIKYSIGDVVFYGSNSQWYRCTQAHTSTTSLTPSSTAGAPYWSGSPLYSTAWDSSRSYSTNDTVRYNGAWYRCISGPTSSNPATSTSNWAKATTPANNWNATTAYTANTSYVSYGGVWYKCTTSNTGQSPNNSDYWVPQWANSWSLTTGAPVVYAESSVAIAGNPSIRTQLRAAIQPAPLLPNALAASTTVQLSSGGTIDSYDSTTGSYTSPGGYSAVVAAGNTSSTAVSITSTTVQGYLAAPSSTSTPFGALVSSGGSLKNPDGSVTAYPAGNANLDLTRISRSPIIPQFDPLPGGSNGLSSAWGNTPKSTALVLSATTNIGYPGAAIPARYYYDGNLSLTSTAPTTLNINGPVILYVRGNVILDGSASPNGVININGTGSLELHLTGALRVNVGSDGINNRTSDPKSLVIVNDSTTSSAQNYSDGTAEFFGLIYMPYMTATNGLTFDSSTTMELHGAVSAKKISYSVNANVHYDTSLRYAAIPGVDQPYTVTDLRELPLTEQATMP